MTLALMAADLQMEWKAAAERFISKRGYMAAEQLRTTLQQEWQQLKAIRQRCCTPAPQVNDDNAACMS